jgi:hypothetical protein
VQQPLNGLLTFNATAVVHLSCVIAWPATLQLGLTLCCLLWLFRCLLPAEGEPTSKKPKTEPAAAAAGSGAPPPPMGMRGGPGSNGMMAGPMGGPHMGGGPQMGMRPGPMMGQGMGPNPNHMGPSHMGPGGPMGGGPMGGQMGPMGGGPMGGQPPPPMRGPMGGGPGMGGQPPPPGMGMGPGACCWGDDGAASLTVEFLDQIVCDWVWSSMGGEGEMLCRGGDSVYVPVVQVAANSPAA